MNHIVSGFADKNFLKDLALSTPQRSSCYIWLSIICLITTSVYLPALSGEFLNFDDHRIYNESIITDLSLENFQKIFDGKHTGFHFNWITLLSYQINWLICPTYIGFITFAIFCHLLQTILFWKICSKFSTTLMFTVLATLIFGLHPLHVNHVVWQSARWHLLSVLFCLFSAWQYLESCDDTRAAHKRVISYLLSVFGFAVISIGRPFYFIFPLTLFVLDILKQYKMSLRLIAIKIPFFLFSTLNILYSHYSGMMSRRVHSNWLGNSLINTLLTDANLNLEYFRQLFIPSPSTLVVPVNHAIDLFSMQGVSDLPLFKIPPLFPLVFLMVLVIVFIHIWARYKIRSPLILLAGIFITLLPVQNIPPRHGIAGVFAYRYAVFSVVFAAPLIAMFLLGLYRKFEQKRVYHSVFLCFLFACIFWNYYTTLQNVNIFKKSENLWSQHLKMLPNSRAGYYYLGKVYQYQNKDPYRAISAYNKALQCPHYWGARDIYPKLAQLYFETGHWEKAERTIDEIPPLTIAKSSKLKDIKAIIYEHSLAEKHPPKQYISLKTQKKVILFDLVHSVRHSPLSHYTRDSIEYNVVQGYGNLQQFLREAGFEVREHNVGRLSPQVLEQIDVLMIGIMSYEAMRMNLEEIDTIVDFVKRGGGLHMVCDHTNAYDNAILANRVLKYFNIEVSDALIVDDNAPKNSWYNPKSFAQHPVTKGLNILVHQAGCALDTNYGVAFTDNSAWADKGDPNNGIARFGNKIKEPDEQIGALPVLAARKFGKGRIVVTTDCNLYANSWIFAYDHYKLTRNAFSWLAKIDPVALPKTRNDILVYEGDDDYFRVNWNSQAYYSFYVNFAHMDSVRAYLSADFSFDKRAIFLFDRSNLKNDRTNQLYEYVKQGGVLIYLCTEKRYKRYRTALLSKFGIKFNIISNTEKDKEYFTVSGDPDLCQNVFHLPWIPATQWTGATAVVYGEIDSQRVYLAEKKVGRGTIYVVPFKKIFKTKYMGRATSSRNPNMRQQQIRRLQENLVKKFVKNSTPDMGLGSIFGHTVINSENLLQE